MKKYTKPSIEVVELSVKESLSALPNGFSATTITKGYNAANKYRNVTIYTKTSTQTPA